MTLRTVARMKLRLPDGRVFPLENDFGPGYPVEAAEYMFMDGNYACDCNRTLMLARAGHPVEEVDCGDTVEMTDFVVVEEEREDGPPGSDRR